MRAFVAIRRVLIKKTNTDLQINEITERLNEHHSQLNSIYNALENLLDKEADAAAEKANWIERERIGFKQ